MQIRPFHETDTDALYGVGLRTGDSGADASAQFRDPKLLGHVFVGPYLALEPELAFVLASPAGPIGYALGALDTLRFEQRCELLWWPPLRTAYPDPSLRDGWTGRSAASPDDEMAYLIHHPHATPAEVVQRFPSHLHIDLLPAGQGQGYGRRMIETLLAALATAGSTGVHLAVATENTRAIEFYRRLGFEDLLVRPTSLLMGKPLPAGT
ncbi:MAG: GNAT family N-acetyltransferase [Sporichthyaceae bacterium]|nr:GNAT family N-acetyltransferase [Sporichthyaceae bacterium]